MDLEESISSYQLAPGANYLTRTSQAGDGPPDLKKMKTETDGSPMLPVRSERA